MPLNSHIRRFPHFILVLLCAGPLLAADNPANFTPRVTVPKIPRRVVNLTNYGGMGDGITLNTEPIAKGIAALAAKGGGELLIPPGFWLTGPVHLASHIRLHLERGALLKFSGDFRLYPLVVEDIKGEKEVVTTSPISGLNLEDAAIIGEGIIDGGGEAWRPVKKEKLTEAEWRVLTKSGGVLSERGDTWWPSREAMTAAGMAGILRRNGSLIPDDYEPAHQFMRPKMLHLLNCRRVLLEGVTFQNPPSWTLNPALCEDVSILHVTVHNAFSAQNSDALDLESCRRAIVRDCTFDAGDDGICLKSGKDATGRRIGAPTEDVLIENCTVYHAHGGFTIGSEMSGGVRNVRVNNCTFMGTDVGLRFKSTRGRGGVVENIFISNIRMTDIPGDAINFDLYYGGKSPADEGGSTDHALPPVTEDTPQFRNIHIENVICRGAQSAIVLEGLPEMPIRDLVFKNIAITSRSGVSLTDVENISFAHVQIENATGPVISLARARQCVFDHLEYPAGAAAVVAIKDAGDRDNVMLNTDLHAAKTDFILSYGATRDAVQVK